MRVFVRPGGALNLLRFPFERWNAEDPVHQSLRHASSITASKRIWQYLGWCPRMVELLREIKYTESLLPTLSVPTIACQSLLDEMVSNRSDAVLEKYGITVIHLPNSTHFYYAPEDAAVVKRTFTDACEPYM